MTYQMIEEDQAPDFLDVVEIQARAVESFCILENDVTQIRYGTKALIWAKMAYEAIPLLMVNEMARLRQEYERGMP